jgi:hypothetical protein
VRRIARAGPDPVLPPPAPAADAPQLTLV